MKKTIRQLAVIMAAAAVLSQGALAASQSAGAQTSINGQNSASTQNGISAQAQYTAFDISPVASGTQLTSGVTQSPVAGSGAGTLTVAQGESAPGETSGQQASGNAQAQSGTQSTSSGSASSVAQSPAAVTYTASKTSSAQTGPGVTRVDSTVGLGGATVTMIKGNEAGQQLSVVIQTSDGKLIVIDGGMDTNRQYLCNFIKQRGGKVDCWLLTHPHVDHVGALTAILERQNDPSIPADDYSKIEIGDIYYSFAPIEFYKANEPSYRIPVIEEAYAALAKHDASKLHYNSPRGTQIQVGNAKITVMNEVFLSTVDAGNNTSIAYKIEINGKKLLFLGDMPYEGAQNLMSLWQPSDLKADVVQMAHHGQHGGSPELYNAIAPQWALWPTHEALWSQRNDAVDESSDVYTIAKTMGWMRALGVKHNYAMCEGDWTLR